MDENVTHKVVMYFAWLGTQGSNPVLLSGCQQHIANVHCIEGAEKALVHATCAIACTTAVICEYPRTSETKLS